MLSLKDPYFVLGVSILVFFTTNFPMLLFINDMIAGYDFPKIYYDMLKLGNMLLFVGYLLTSYFNSTHKNVDFIKDKFSNNAR